MDRKKYDFLKEKGISAAQSISDAISDLERIHGTVITPDSKNFMSGLYSNISKSNYQNLMRNGLKKQVPDSHRFANHKPNTVKKFKSILENKYSSKEISMMFHTKKASTVLQKESCATSTLTTLPDDFIHYSEPRILTVREYARIQSFPD